MFSKMIFFIKKAVSEVRYFFTVSHGINCSDPHVSIDETTYRVNS